MDEITQRMFETFHSFKKLRISDMMPYLSHSDFAALMAIEHPCHDPHENSKPPEKNEHGRISITVLAKRLRVSTPAVSRSLKNLEEKNYVVRKVDAQDRRNTYVELTPEGRAILNRAENDMNDFSNTVVNNMGKEDMERLIRYMQQLFEVSRLEIERRKEIIDSEKEE